MNVASIHTVNISRPSSLPEYARGDIYPPLQNTNEPISVHILGGDQTVLFGTAYADTVDEITSYLDGFDTLDVIVVEHGHPDHYDAAGELATIYDADVAIPERDATVLENIGVAPDIELGHDEVRWGGVRTVRVPGHTPGNMSFLHEPTETLIAGDSVVHNASFLAAPGNWRGAFAPCVPELNDDDKQARENIEILSEYFFESALVTHGPNVIGNASRELETLIDELAGRGGSTEV